MRWPWVSRARYDRLAANVERLERSRRDLKARNVLLKKDAFAVVTPQIKRMKKGLESQGREIARLRGQGQEKDPSMGLAIGQGEYPVEEL